MLKEKVLIIEDEKKLAEVMMLYLKNEGYEVTCVHNGEDGEKAIEGAAYDLILLDIMMP